jgi:CHAT domain-containing protein
VTLFYWIAPERSFLWVVARGGVELHTLPGEAAIRERVEAHQARILQGRDPLAEGAEEARWLYRSLVAPAEARIAKGSRVAFAPDGALHLVNPETLVVPGKAPHYWIDDVTLVTAPSISLASVEAGSGARQEEGPAILLIGDPLTNDREFPRLIHATRELDVVAGQFPASRAVVYAGASADPTVYRASSPGRFPFIHFAAHAQANREAPLESAIVLTERNESWRLYARDVMGVPLRAELVTLSACRTAGSRAYAGEGLVGLTWAFLGSGARNVIAGLWNVEDASTAELMESLYRGVGHGEPPAVALRRAKLELRESDAADRKPFDWAPVVIYTRRAARAAARPS